MLSSRDRVLKALAFEAPDRVPRDLGGMRSTSISAFLYPRLVAALGLPPRLPRLDDTTQMLALPDLDVLNALGADVVAVLDGVTNAFDQPDAWHSYDFNGRLPAEVRNPATFWTEADGTIVQGGHRMPPSAYVFEELHAGQPLVISGDLPRPDPRQVELELRSRELRDEQVRALAELCRRAREATDRAVFFNDASIHTSICIHGYGGLAVFPILCLTEPDLVHELHEIATQHTLRNLRALLPEIRDSVDIVMLAADDWGTQRSLMASPKVFRSLFLPYRRRLNDEAHRLAPAVKTYLHSCGAIYDLIDLVIESGFDILNPVQWSAGGHSYRDWKDRARGRIALWGGGVNSQVTLPLGSVDDVRREASEVVSYLSQDGGYVFCNIHNILAEVEPEKVIAMYRAAGEH